MRDMAGGSYRKALVETFTSELLSMNLLMAGMIPTVMWLRANIPAAADPLEPAFWFVMSMGLLVGFIVAYPMNWWLVAQPLEARHDDGATERAADFMQRMREAVPACARHGHEPQAGSATAGPGDGCAVVRCARDRRRHRARRASAMIAATGRLVSLEAARRRRLQRTRRTGRSVAPWPWSPGAFLVLANERSRKPLGNQNVPDVAATRLQDTATAGKSAHQTAQYVARTRAGNGRIIEVTGLDQLADAPEHRLAELLLAGTTGALCVRSDKSGQVHRPAVGDDGVAFDDTRICCR